MTGIMGGTFNPIHYGHLLMCEAIREEFGLKKILFIPAQNPPHKSLDGVLEGTDRLNMVKLAIEGNPFFDVSTLELERSGLSYTVDTLKLLKEALGEDEQLLLIIGADSLVQLPSWKAFRGILELAALIVAKRPDTLNHELEWSAHALRNYYGAKLFISEAPAYDFSSTAIRERIKNGLSIHYMVPEKVEHYIRINRLYR